MTPRWLFGSIYLATGPALRVDGSISRPWPGARTCPTAKPISMAIVVTISKYTIAFSPIRPTPEPADSLAMPPTTVRKMIGAITILTKRTNASPNGCICTAKSG